MARSKYIYMVRSKLTVFALFTVKHEMVSWLQRQYGEAEDARRVLKIWRFSDGAHGEPVLMGTAQEVMDA